MDHARPLDAVHGHRDVIAFFAYGTLRPGGSNYAKLAPLIEPEVTSAVVRGRMYASTAGAWPLLELRDRGDDWVHGTLFTASPTPNLWGLMGMIEVEWGYDLVWHPIHANPTSPSLGRALMCAWPWSRDRGELIPGGDWLRFAAGAVPTAE
jgi:gamma-glutamylcyclotransferase (GGCT)/AIG2-like uncharacterized protein YtfP